MSEVERFKPFVAVYLVLIKDGQILLSQRYNTGYQDGNYSLVSGHIDGGETTKECIVREAKEEAGITLQEQDLEVVNVLHRFRPEREYFDIYIRAEKWTGEVANMEQDKCSELKWYNLNNLPDNLIPEVRFTLNNIAKGIHYGEIGWDQR